MLSHIHIRNLAIVDQIEVELTDGMTTLTGETGAGKSILVDALGLVLGDRADSSMIRHGQERAEISVSFDISTHAAVNNWLQARDMDDDGECQLRRIISRQGRSRGYINGQPAPVHQLRELGEQLVDIHGQHEHQSLLHTAVQRQLLDAFGGHQRDLDQVATLSAEWQAARQQLDALLTDDAQRDARLDLLRYQLQELDALGMTAADIEAIDSEHARLANAGRLLSACQAGLQQLDGDEGISAHSLLSQTVDELRELAELDTGLGESAGLLNEAVINLQEGISALQRYTDGLELDPQRLHWLEERIGLLHDLARKHQCRPTELPDVALRLREELETIQHAGEHRAELESRVTALATDWQSAADRLTMRRRKAAATFSREISDAMQTLGMAGGEFEVELTPRESATCNTQGQDEVVFLVSANRGQPLQPLARVASGGELSRISLSIQVISAGGATRSTLIFDEVDSGIGGGVAEIVGRKLRALANGRQVLCVTHLPQVAALAHQQLQVSKSTVGDITTTHITTLDPKQRVDELARMLGGVKITQQTRDHAREMIERAQAKITPARRTSRKTKA